MKKLSYILSVTILLLGLAGCGSDTAGPGVDEAPGIPNLEFSQPDVSYFNGSGQKVSSELPSANFQAAQAFVLGLSAFSSIGQIYSGFLQGSQNTTPSFSNGVWEWSYDYSFQGTSSTVRLTAQETGSSINWDLFFSIDSPEISFTDYNMMSGTTSNDGMEGNWTFNTIFGSSGTEMPFLESNWLVTSDTEQTVSLVVYDEQGAAIANIDYEQTGSEHLMTIDVLGASGQDAEVFWDATANIGYIQQSGEKVCWQGDAQNATDVVCADVGL